MKKSITNNLIILILPLLTLACQPKVYVVPVTYKLMTVRKAEVKDTNMVRNLIATLNKKPQSDCRGIDRPKTAIDSVGFVSMYGMSCSYSPYFWDFEKVEDEILSLYDQKSDYRDKHAYAFWDGVCFELNIDNFPNELFLLTDKTDTAYFESKWSDLYIQSYDYNAIK